MGILITGLVAGVVLLATQGIASVIQGVWLNSIGQRLAVFENMAIGQILIQPYFTWIIAISLFLFAVRLLTRAK